MESHSLIREPAATVNPGNLIVWSAGLGLQILLLLVLALRGMAGRLWSFTVLLGIYVARSLLLFALFGHIGRESYALLYETAGWTDIALRILLFAEIAMPLARGEERGLNDRTKRALLLLLGIILAAAAAGALPSRGPVFIDRGSVFASLLMVLLVLFRGRLSSFACRVAGGMALYGAVAIAADLVRSRAFVERNKPAWVAAAYAESGVWLLVLLGWLFAFLMEKRVLGPPIGGPGGPEPGSVH